jgi:hypothetical protein
MNLHRLARTAALALTATAIAAPVAAAQQDLRSADAQDAARSAEIQQGQPRQDLRSPDSRDRAAGRGTFSAPDVTVVKVAEPSSSSTGLDWGDAGLGAGAMLGLILLALGGALAVVHRRRRPAGGQPVAG